MLNNILNTMFAILGAIIFVGIGIKIIQDRLSHEIKVHAMVLDKQTYKKQKVSHSQPVRNEEKYLITFLVEDKKRSFYTSKMSYDQCQLKQQGILKYRGSRFIEFI